MIGQQQDFTPLAATVALAAALWLVAFYLPFGVFWYKIAGSAFVLAAVSLFLQPPARLFFPSWRSVLLGIFSAVLLYLTFWAGKAVSTAILPFASQQVGQIYHKGQGTPAWIIVFLLFCITGPCEEIYWRRYLQHRLMRRLGSTAGWVLATFLYAGVHIWSGNFMLICAAGVAGAFWGVLYWQFRDIWAVIISHSIWSTVVFAVLPIP